jgi:hypothetical protein
VAAASGMPKRAVFDAVVAAKTDAEGDDEEPRNRRGENRAGPDEQPQ